MDMGSDGYFATLVLEEPRAGEPSVWFAEHPALPGCHGVGSSVDGALESLERSRNAWLSWARNHDVPIPPMQEQPSVFIQYAARSDVAHGAEIGSEVETVEPQAA